jgi:hypothetical protein
MNKFNRRPLERALLDMRRHGVLAEADWTCCMSCGVSEMRAVADDCPKGQKPIGYCFYHGQDAAVLEETGVTMLAFGGFGKTKDAVVGRIAVECLRRAGAAVNWSGDERQRIEVRLARPAKRKVKK